MSAREGRAPELFCALLPASARAAEEKRVAEARAEAEKKQRAASEAGTKGAALASLERASGGTDKFDGAYNGTMCNFPNNPTRKACRNVRLNVQNGAATATWRSRVPGKFASAQFTIGPSGAKAVLDGWNMNDGTPLAGALAGRVSDDRIDLAGRWANGAPIDGHWTRSP